MKSDEVSGRGAHKGVQDQVRTGKRLSVNDGLVALLARSVWLISRKVVNDRCGAHSPGSTTSLDKRSPINPS